MADGWTKTQTIATGISLIGLVAILIASFALVVDRIQLVHKRDENLKSTDDIRWGNNYANYANRITASKEDGGISHKSERWNLYTNKSLIDSCRPLERIAADRTTQTSESVSTDDEDEKSAGLQNRGLGNMRPAWTMFHKPCIETTREELIALALVMGASIKIQDYTESLNVVGAFGLPLYAIPNHGSWTLGLTQGSRIPRHAPTMGSGYTTLMAKHLACGSVPFAQNSGWVKTVFLKKLVLEALKTGGNIKDELGYRGPSLELLRMLPAEKEIDAYYGVADEEDKTRGMGVGLILRPSGKPEGGWDPFGNWPRAVANIAFGGLVPQVHSNVAEAVQFTTWARRKWDDDTVVNELERLVDTLHNRMHDGKTGLQQHKTNADFAKKRKCGKCIFGEHVIERCKARKLIDYVNFTVPWKHSNPRAAAAVFSRYSNLLEHVITLCDFSVQVSAQSIPTHPVSQKTSPSAKSSAVSSAKPLNFADLLFDRTGALLQAVYTVKVQNPQPPNPGHISDYTHTSSLGKTLASIIDKRDLGSRANGANKPLSLEDGAFIVRCVLAAWSWQVHNIQLIELVDEDEEQVAKEGGENQVKERSRIATIDELPPVFVFG
ncbi:hypothetical protein P154DRAFT_586332 [Amniculicola lignicola CBS 123094]|uniref:Uncharacterized protein n=1 Tax=Amniculicola lignicola CBS 123094 TaxID=1392246 RepID=A0A6A5WUU0_9PLEO|nr:hypothetical protein P154DRAFT_586332 [Amniculicola lignicola CBS 123094]